MAAVQLNDARYTRLSDSGYLGPHVNEMLVEWLTAYIVELGGTVVNEQVDDLWLQMLELYTASTGARNDLMFTWLVGLGYQITALPDMLWSFWNDPTELPGGAPAASLTLFTLRTFEAYSDGGSVVGADGMSGVNSGTLGSTAQASEGTVSMISTVTPASFGVTWGGFITTDWNANGFQADEEFWVQYDCYIPAGFNWMTNSPMKFFRFRTEDDINEEPYKQFTFGIGNGSDNTTNNFRINPEAGIGTLDDIMPASFGRDKWVRFEFYVKKGVSEVTRCWIDNEFFGEMSGFDTLGPVGDVANDKIKFEFFDYFNGAENSVRVAQSTYIDNIKIATSSTQSPTETDLGGRVFIGNSVIT